MDTYSFIALLSAAIVLVSALFLVRKHNQKLREELTDRKRDADTFRQIELIRVQNPSQKDLQAYHLIETERQQVWKSLSTKTSIAPHIIFQRSFDLIRKVATIYHPDIENPEFQISLFDLVELNERITERIKEYFDDFPLNTIKDFNIQDILKYKGYYDQFSQFKFIKVAQKYQHLYHLGRYAWMGYNALNPWYWGRKVVFTAGKEGTLRYLLTVIITIVGEEAVLVYSKRHIRTPSVAIEKNIAFEMINMAVLDNVVSQEEYETVLHFVLNSSHLSDRIKVTLLKALLRKRPLKAPSVSSSFSEKEKRRLLSQVERVAKADKLSILKKREALKALETSLNLKSSYRAQLELAPHEEVHSANLMQQHRQREEALLKLIVQAASLEGSLPEALREYTVQRAISYPLPFDETEQTQILHEATDPTSLDTLTNSIRTKDEKTRTLSEILDALLWYLPFTRQKEEFYTQLVAALDLKSEGNKFLRRRLEQLLPPDKQIESPPFEVLKSLFRLLVQEEQMTALQETSTTYQFILKTEEKTREKKVPFWLCVTTKRILVLTATMINHTIYHHHLEFQDDLSIHREQGKLYDTYLLHDNNHEIRLESRLFHASKLQHALERYLKKKER